MLCVFVGWWCHSSCHVWLPYVSDPCWNEICSHSIFTVPHSVHLPWQYVYRLLAIFLGSPCYCLHKLGRLMMNISGTGPGRPWSHRSCPNSAIRSAGYFRNGDRRISVRPESFPHCFNFQPPPLRNPTSSNSNLRTTRPMRQGGSTGV